MKTDEMAARKIRPRENAIYGTISTCRIKDEINRILEEYKSKV